MERRTHRGLDEELCGRPLLLEQGHAKVQMVATARMRADEHDLVHGGFVFGLADHAAMLAINHPNVVLGNADVRFEQPVRVGEMLVAEARVRPGEGKKVLVDVEVHRDATRVCRGELICFTPPRHVLAEKEDA